MNLDIFWDFDNESEGTKIVGDTTCPCPGGGSVSAKRLFELLRTVPGVGSHAALAWMGEVVDPARFVHPKAVAAADTFRLSGHWITLMF